MKKIVSVLLAVTMTFNVIAFDIFNVRAKAVAEVLVYGVEALIGVIIGVTSSLGGKVVSEMADFDAYDNAYKYAISQGDYIGLVQNDDGSYRFYSKIPIGSDANEDAVKYSEFFADYLNNHMSQSLIESYLYQYEAGNYQNIMKANTYKEVKNAAIEAFQNYLYAIVKAEEDLENNGELAEVEGLASYNFDFVGPMQGMTLPTKTGYVQAEIDGFKLSTPQKCPTGDIYCPNEKTAYELGATSVVPYANSEKCIGWKKSNVFSVGYYVIYNNELYFRGQLGAGKMREYQWNVLPNDNTISSFKTYSGKKLIDVGCSTLVGLYYGFYYGLSESVGGIPKAKADDLIDTVGGGTLEIDRDDAENLIGRLQDIGILGEDPELGLNENGEIVSADGIDLSTLENLLNQLLDGQVQFEDFEGYLQQITQLLGKSNVNTSSIEHIQSNILAYEADQTRTLDDINSAIRSQANSLSAIQTDVHTIADALTKTSEAELDKTYEEVDGVIVDHSGLAEATAIVSNLGIVSQCQTLIMNVLNSYRNTEQAPNFQFYYDSNKDGVQEVYTALDLSFLDRPLTNSNLVDKDRFQKSMTVREFIQLLMILVCYFGFFLKMLRKLPGLVGGAESSSGASMEINSLEKQGKLG